MKNGLKRGGLSAQSRVGWPPSLTGKSEGKATRDTERETKRESEKKREKAREKVVTGVCSKQTLWPT